MTDRPGDGPERRIIERTVDTSSERPNYYVLETIAEAEDVDITTLPPMYERIDHMLDELFSNPPAPEAQVEVTFSYHGYRITVTQDGNITSADSTTRDFRPEPLAVVGLRQRTARTDYRLLAEGRPHEL